MKSLIKKQLKIYFLWYYIFLLLHIMKYKKKKILSVIDFECKWYVNSTTGNYASLTLIVALKWTNNCKGNNICMKVFPLWSLGLCIAQYGNQNRLAKNAYTRSTLFLMTWVNFIKIVLKHTLHHECVKQFVNISIQFLCVRRFLFFFGHERTDCWYPWSQDYLLVILFKFTVKCSKLYLSLTSACIDKILFGILFRLCWEAEISYIKIWYLWCVIRRDIN